MSSSYMGSTGGIQSQALLYVLRNRVIKRHETDHMYNQDNSCGCTIYYKAAIMINQLAFMNAINKATAHLNFHKDTQRVPVDHDKQLVDYNMDMVMQIEEMANINVEEMLNVWVKVPAFAAQQCRILYPRNHARLLIITYMENTMYGEYYICLEWKTYQVDTILYNVFLKIYNLMQPCISSLLVICGLLVWFGIMTLLTYISFNRVRLFRLFIIIYLIVSG